MKRVVRARDVGLVFDSEYFEYYFAADLGRTDYVALIQSAFVTRRGVRRLTPAIKEARARGVRICMFIQELRNWRTPAAIKSDDERNRVLETKAAIKMLEEMGVHVTVRRGRHEKIAVLDEIVLYDGSLNKMSYTNETNERITRSVDVEKASEAIILQRLYECRMCQLEVQPWQKHVILQPESLGEVIGKRRRWSELSQREIAELVFIQRRFATLSDIGTCLDWIH